MKHTFFLMASILLLLTVKFSCKHFDLFYFFSKISFKFGLPSVSIPFNFFH